MSTPTHLDATRAFSKKALNFIKYYPLLRKDPREMLQRTLQILEELVSGASSVSELEPLCREARMMTTYSDPDGLFQIEIEGDKDKFIVYRPVKFLGPDRSDGKIVVIHDLIYIPRAS